MTTRLLTTDMVKYCAKRVTAIGIAMQKGAEIYLAGAWAPAHDAARSRTQICTPP